MARYALIIASLVAFLVTAAAANVLVPALQRIRMQQMNHPAAGRVPDVCRAGTPTMGGIALVLGALLGVGAAWMGLSLLDAKLLDGHQRMNLMLALAAAFAFAAVGFADDYIRAILCRGRGLRGWQQLALQLVVILCFLAGLHFTGSLDTGMVVPFAGYVDFGAAYYPVSVVLILSVVNAAAITDGADGACGCVAFPAMLALMVVCGLLNYFQLSLFAASMAGAVLAILMWNFPPAKITLGRTGSLFLGGSLVTVCYCMGWPSLLVLLAGMYLLEGLSVLAQGLWFRLTKRLLLRGVPLHEAMRQAGWSPVRVVAVLGGGAAACMLLAMLFVRIS